MKEKIDKLNRNGFIQFIKNLIDNSEKYKRHNDTQSYVIALDSPWGTGKSYFVDLLIDDIEKNNENIKVVLYNAWKNDYCENPFNPLFYDIISNDCFASEVSVENQKILLSTIFKLIPAFAKSAFKCASGLDDFVDAAFETGETLKNMIFEKIPVMENLRNEREAFEQFSTILKSATEWFNDRNHKLVIIIDELDRCKPTFAIQTLEIVKHIFNIENLVFLFTIDIHQLSHSIKCVYGQDMDSIGYLCRFFDYIAKMPSPDVQPYIKETIKTINTIPLINVLVQQEPPKYCNLSDSIIAFLVDTYNSFNMSLRDFDTIIQSYKIMLDNFLKNYKNLGAHIIYLFYLTLKYKYPVIFNKIFLENLSVGSELFIDFPLVRKLLDNNLWISNSFWGLNTKEKIADNKYAFSFDGTDKTEGSAKAYITEVKSDRISYRLNPRQRSVSQSVEIDEIFSVNTSLFYQDLQHWDDIKDYTYREYLHKNLEMYNFVQD